MRHVGAYHRNVLSFRQPRASVIQRLIKPEHSFAAGLPKPLKILNRSGRSNHGSQRGSVWRDHEILAQPAFKAESGNTETGILIGEIDIPGVVSRLGNPPGHAALASVFNLP